MPSRQKRIVQGLAASVLVGGLSALAVSTAQAAASSPTLHGFCKSDAPCTDNGTNTPTSVNPPNFGFSAGGSAATGTVWIDILVPDNVTLPLQYILSGPFLGANVTASLVAGPAWTSGFLDAYLGISASPANPIGAFLPATQVFQPTATGFFVYKANIGTKTLPSNAGASDSDIMTTDLALAQGSYIVAFIDQGLDKQGATANSGAILETGLTVITHGGIPEPATWTMMILGLGGVGATLRARRRAMAAA